MKQEMTNWPNSKRTSRPVVFAYFFALTGSVSPAHALQASQASNHPLAAPSVQAMAQATSSPSAPSAIAPGTQCPPVQHWDPGTRMCMPDGDGASAAGQERPRPRPTVTAVPGPGPGDMPPGSSPGVADRPSDANMNMAVAGERGSNSPFMFHWNQFLVRSSTSGPRGNTRVTGPGMWMLMYDNHLSVRNHLSVQVMGSFEQWTVGDRGTPQLLQIENLDAMHPHDTLMAVEFRDAITLGGGDDQQLTFLFAPRGEAAVGAVPFMHRQSAEGNPDAPLGHTLQDGFHDVSTVLGMGYRLGRTTLEATAFSGQSIRWPLPLHSPDSYSLRLIHGINDHFSVGASYADVLLPEDTGGSEHGRFVSAWLASSHRIGQSSLRSSLIWAQGRTGRSRPLNSFLGEIFFQGGMNHFYGRAEVLQITPDQLELVPANGNPDARWVEALTVGYERSVFRNDRLSLFVGGSYTRDFIPAAYQPSYRSDPQGIKVYLRITTDASRLRGATR
jgi:hypothetical protein